MNQHTARAISNVGVLILTGFALFYTGSLWSLLILLFLTAYVKDTGGQR